MNYRILISCLIWLSVSQVHGQTAKAFESAADKAFESKDYFSSLKYMEKALEHEPENAQFLFKHAESARMFESYLIAERSYERLLATYGDSTFKSAFYGLAAVEQNLGKYDEAVKHYEEYLIKTDGDADKMKATSKGIEDCDWALEQLNRPLAGVLLERMGTGINTPNSEFNPVRIGDTLYFSSFRDEKWKDKHYPIRPIVKLMESVDQVGSIALPINAQDKHTAHMAHTEDGSILISNFCEYTKDFDTDIRCKLYMRTKMADGKWSEAVELPANINVANTTNTQPNIATNPDGSYTLFFVSDREGGKGKLDIWKARFDAQGTFGQPENLTQLNTDHDDITPFFDAKGNALYFSTTGRRTLGGFDIFQSKYSTDLGWQEPEHLAVPFNSSYHDVYYFQRGNEAWFSSNRTGSVKFTEESCCFDIYKATYLDLGLDVYAFSELSKTPLDNVIFTLVEKPLIGEPTARYSAEKNTTDFNVLVGKQYWVIASKEGYLPDTIDVVTDIVPDNRRWVGNLYLKPQDFDLAVFTYNGISKKPLDGVSIRLLEMSTEQVKQHNTKETNTADVKVRMGTPYMLIAEKNGFSSDTNTIDIKELRFGEKSVKRLYLDPGTMGGVLPLIVYFDNDQPDARTRSEVTAKSYDETYKTYVAKKEEFATSYATLFSGEDKIAAQERVRYFFDNDVYGGFSKLENLADNLDLFLTNGYKIEIMVKGFASPLAQNDYNMSLTRRRVVCVTNYLRKVRGGIYDPFLQKGQLAVTLAPYGEDQSDKTVSDNARDRKRSVFSPEASKERRAEVLEVRMSKF